MGCGDHAHAKVAAQVQDEKPKFVYLAKVFYYGVNATICEFYANKGKSMTMQMLP